MSDLIRYTIDAAGRTKFVIRSFGSVKIYLNAWLDEKTTQAKRAAIEQKRAVQQREQRLRDQYDLWWRDEVARLRATANPDEIATLVNEATAKLLEDHQNPIGFDFMVRRYTDVLIANRYNVPDFEQWKARKA